MQYLLQSGYSIIPVGSNKTPLVSWKEYQDRLPTEEEVIQWWGSADGTTVGEYHDAGIGIVTGKVSGLTVVDIDVKEEPVTDRGVFPLTYTVQTRSGGYHLYYEYDGGGVRTGSDQYKDYPHVDIRNDGGYVVAPPTSGYEVIESCPMDVFPKELFSTAKKKTGMPGSGFKLDSLIGKSKGSRNQSITQAIGTILAGLPEAKWQSQGWPVIEKLNEAMSPPLGEAELKRTFESIASAEQKKHQADIELAKEVEQAADGTVESPMQMTVTEAIMMRLRGNKSGPYKDVDNVSYVLENHTEWAGKIWYDTFTKRVIFCGRALKDNDAVAVQKWLQNEMDLANVAIATVRDAMEYVARINERSSALEWVRSLKWDGFPRVDHWLHTVYGVEDSEYHTCVGRNWLIAMMKRLEWPGSKFDHVMVLQGGQGVRKTTSFSVLGGEWHVETGTDVSSKDFLQQMDGNMIVEFSEGDTLSRSQTQALKMVITRQVDKYRAPYGRVVEEHPRQCVFCMTTNDVEFLKDTTGNRRWWMVRMPNGIEANIEWLKENRDQLFAEAYSRRKEPTWEVPLDVAEELQEAAQISNVLDEWALRWYATVSPADRADGVKIGDFEHWFEQKTQRHSKGDSRSFYEMRQSFRGVLKLEPIVRKIDGKANRVWVPTPKTPDLGYEPEPISDEIEDY